MHLRRALLLLALVLGVASLVAALVPVPRERAAEGPVATPPRQDGARPRTLRFAYPARAHGAAPSVRLGSHVVLEVTAASAAGQVTLEGLGLVEPVEPGTPASFDVLASSAGSYAVVFQPTEGRPSRLGALVVR